MKLLTVAPLFVPSTVPCHWPVPIILEVVTFGLVQCLAYKNIAVMTLCIAFTTCPRMFEYPQEFEGMLEPGTVETACA